MFDNWLFVDLADLKGWAATNRKGARQPYSGNWADVRYLSVAHTPVGPTILNRCPNLRAVLVRSHGTEKVDRVACKRAGVRVFVMGPTTQNCASWIEQRLGPGPFVFIGAGRIAGAVRVPAGVGTFYADTLTTPRELSDAAATAGTIIGTVPAPTRPGPPVYDSTLFRWVRPGVRFVSISRPATLDNAALLAAVLDGRVAGAYVDTLGPDLRDKLLATGRVYWTNHTAWKTDFCQADHLQNLKNWCTYVENRKPGPDAYRGTRGDSR